MTDRELLECLNDRPCEACKFHSDKGCSKWDCVFDGKKALEQEPLEVEAAELQKAYNKGFEDCRQATIEAFQMFRGYEANRTNAEWVDRIETVVEKLPPVNPQEPKIDTWSIKDVADTLAKHGLIVEPEPKYCDRNICVSNEYNGIGCDECEVTKSQEPREDAISRQAVLETLDDMDNVLDEDRIIENYKELLKECYEVLPSVNPTETVTEFADRCRECGAKYGKLLKQELKWVPVRDRLPRESDGTVLITVNGEVKTGIHSEFNDTWYIGDMCGVGGNDPLAWMPLPEPYKAESEGV